MLDALGDLHPVLQALLAGCFTWFVTALGAALVFFTRSVNRKLLDASLGFAAGVMVAASYWSLLAPAIAMSEEGPLPSWLPPAIGFLLGGAFLRLCDRIIPHVHLFMPTSQAEGISTTWKRTVLLVLAITLHNIPEGLAVGVAFGAAAATAAGVEAVHAASLGAAVALAVGIGLQNFPEGMAVALPLRREGISIPKSFFYGQISGVVEPAAAVIGAAAVLLAQPLLPYALAFAAGAMIFVVVEEVVPESQQGGHGDIATLGTMLGFTVMMVLDVALG